MEPASRIAVAGATGRVGRHVVDLLERGGHEVGAMSRSVGVDVITGDGLAEALEGVACVIDTATGPSPEQAPATEFFTTAARNLHAAGERAGVRRIVAVSIIGCDRFKAGYNMAKVEHERAVLDGPVEGRVLRAAQFHEFVAQFLEWGNRGDVIYVPRMRTQLVAARTVAEALVDVALDPDPPMAGAPIPEIAGPREEDMVEAARLLAYRRGDSTPIEGMSDPDDPDRDAFERGGLLPSPHATLGGPTFGEWLETALLGAAS
jgi:uncharacterized protein YbjT (DUF2867 family)